MSVSNTFEKDPRARLDYTINWVQNWLLSNDMITGSTWSPYSGNPPGVAYDTPTFTTGSSTIWISSGTINQTYRFDVLIGTTQGRQDSRNILIVIEDK